MSNNNKPNGNANQGNGLNSSNNQLSVHQRQIITPAINWQQIEQKSIKPATTWFKK